MTDSKESFPGPHQRKDMIDSRYRVISYIGAGGMQHVYNAYDEVLQRNVALKTPIDSSGQKRFLESAIYAAKVNHPNVAKTLDYVEWKNRQYLVEELINGYDLDKALIKKVPCVDPYLVARIFHNLAKGIAASHHAKVIHRDLKPTNVMVSGPFASAGIKVTDFGIATMAEQEIIEEVNKDLTNSTSKTVVGAIPYMAPEAITTPKKVTNKADVWSLAAMTFELLTGSKPFGSGLSAVYRIIGNEAREYPAHIKRKPQFKPLAEQLIQIIESCFVTDPSSRPTADEIVRKCSTLCYATSERHTGVVRHMMTQKTGFIVHSRDGIDVFFHTDSVYGEDLGVDDEVMFSMYPSNDAPRAHPVVKIK